MEEGGDRGVKQEEYEAIIAAKLEPLKKILARAEASESTLDMWSDVGKALALLSGEE